MGKSGEDPQGSRGAKLPSMTLAMESSKASECNPSVQAMEVTTFFKSFLPHSWTIYNYNSNSWLSRLNGISPSKDSVFLPLPL